MIRLEAVRGRRDRRRFYGISSRVYREFHQHRSTEDDVMEMLVEKRSAYLEHASVDPFLLLEGRRVVGRLALIQDRKLPDYVQVAFFEALPGLEDLLDPILLKARALHPQCSRVVVGLHGHLNYGAGFLVSPHELPPIFGLPWTPPYYLDYFEALERRDMVSFRFDAQGFYRLLERVEPSLDLGNIRIRTMRRDDLAREVDLYTWMNNACFQQHPYWADRTTTEDWELFHPFRFLMKDENLIFAEENGRPVGFLLWYPDFNELVKGDEPLGLRHALRYHLRNPIKTVRLTEIAVHPACRDRGVVPGMIMKMIRSVMEGGYAFCEGGFIFEENADSMGMTLRYLSKAFGSELEPSRRYCVFDGEL
jgi:ribosomal protein S18 acetylase RimI-like enzyme